MGTALVIENDPTDDVRRLGEWLTEAGLRLEVRRPHAGDALPETLDGYVALVVLGGEQSAYPAPDGTPGAPWFPALEGLLRKAVRHRVATLAVCLGAQLLATAHAGTVERSPSGPEIGPGLVGKRDAADTDPLFKYVPLMPDVLQWHLDEITELPRNAVLLAASTRYPHQAFRVGDRAWGLQFHIECDAAMIADWAADSAALTELGYDAAAVVAACDAVLPDVEDVWQPFVARFAALALGELDGAPPRTLPLLGQ
ncbi:GMP synthase-Glutamine amidotransferase [Micromonospora pattaloongensis]|uniref:GMP synthase-Glutamine amidotransferase n=1 Tax=Micromonospora pattaloongensis TaxID=405436 RepID=A0A1H3PUX6_9ACTN|nr:type 1 glutamine amidotransferase [Micromonospora pattaloongensis]SDZ05084.1 GMP synthase-Glutamine amidotransferase [Micromonospora pattaloongensis]